MSKERECCFCGKTIKGNQANNAWPFKGYCCNECNLKKTILARMSFLEGYALLFRVSDDSSDRGLNGLDAIINPALLTLRDLQEKVGGYIEPIHLSDGYVALVDEDGKLKGLPVNRLWSKFYLSDECVPLVGNVLLIKEEFLK